MHGVESSTLRLATRSGDMALDLGARVRIVQEIAANAADDVDREASFPQAAIDAAKTQGLLALLIPADYGGGGATVSEAADVCYKLGQACASTAMIVAMHHAALACVIRHSSGSVWHQQLLRRAAAQNLLFASSTTEGLGGGSVRSSASPLMRDGNLVSLDRDATVVSYGAQADGIVTTARRDSSGAASDQALVVFLKEDYGLAPTGAWETIGMRGTCSAGFALKAVGHVDQIIPVGYDKIHPQSMVPVSHLVWSAVWTGIAAAAVERAQMFVRTAARRAGGAMPPGAGQFTKALAGLGSLRGRLVAALARFEDMRDDTDRLGSLEVQTALNLLKVDVSEQAVSTVTAAMRACGLAGYRTDGDFAMGRHLRDILSAPIMVHNDRILSNVATAALMSSVPSSLRDQSR